MKSYSAIHWRTVLVTVCTLVFAIGMTAKRARADEWDKRTILTVNQTIDVGDIELQPGQYVFRLLDSNSDRHTVQIFNGNQTHLISTVLAIPTYRMNPTSDTKFTFWEIPGSSVMAMQDWYYAGDSIGQEFPYPKHPSMDQTAALRNPPPAPAPQVPTPAAAEATTGEALPATPPVPEPAPVTQPSQTAEVPVQTADATQNGAAASTPSQSQTPQSTPADASQADSTPAQLPTTASPFPLIGLSGLLSLGAFGLLRRRKQSA